MNVFYQLLNEIEGKQVEFPDLPVFDSWAHYQEGYHNHFHRFRGKNVTFMEIGIQSGGKIGIMRDYFGPGFKYIGIDINNSTRMFDTADWINVEIGNSEDREFLRSMKKKYPHVDIFLDDGGHTMKQQMIAIEEMLPHVHEEGVYICEDLSTTWARKHFGGVMGGDVSSQKFLEGTMYGLVHKTMDWLQSDWISGGLLKPVELPDDAFPEKWWKTILRQVKHIHFYNQFVVYEKGKTYKGRRITSVGKSIPYRDSGVHKPVDWDPILKKLQEFTGSPWDWDNDKTQNQPLRKESPISKSVWDVLPFEHTKHVEYAKGVETDAFNPFMNVFYQLLNEIEGKQVEFPDLPVFDSWAHYQEGYHNHFHRFRGKNVTFMEIGIQSGGKIGIMRDYFGPGFKYIGIDINNSTRMFDTADWINVEIGNSEDREFLRSMKKKYPHVDIFLDDGGHTMKQQMIAIEEMLPHVHEEGVYICEDLSTTWARKHFGGVMGGDVSSQKFLEGTMYGLVHKTMDWLQSDWISGGLLKPVELPDDAFPEKWWKTILRQVKHIHFYNQFVVYEKGKTHKPHLITTVGASIPYTDSGYHKPVDWDPILKKLQTYTGSPWVGRNDLQL